MMPIYGNLRLNHSYKNFNLKVVTRTTNPLVEGHSDQAKPLIQINLKQREEMKKSQIKTKISLA